MTQEINKAMLTLLGFSAYAEDPVDVSLDLDEYGCPYTEFHDSERVTDIRPDDLLENFTIDNETIGDITEDYIGGDSTIEDKEPTDEKAEPEA